MANEVEQPIDKLTQLIASWDEKNIALALQIISSDKELMALANARFLPLLALVNQTKLSGLASFVADIVHLNLDANTNLPFDESLLPLFQQLPCQGIYCHYEGINALPWWLFELRQLRFLDLNGVGISALPSAISQLENLEALRAEQNSLEVLPDSIGELSQLQKLQLDFNKIKELPDSIGSLSQLNWLCLEGNPIEALPSTVLQLQKLRWLSVEKTPLGDRNDIQRGLWVTPQSEVLKKLVHKVKP